MKLYHYCPLSFLESIKEEGLTKGCIPMFQKSKVVFGGGFQWLTTNPSFEQSWENIYTTLPYRRNEVRLTIKIPEGDKNLIKWLDFCSFNWTDIEKGDSIKRTAEILNSFGDPERWYLYSGNVKPEWIKKIVYNPEYPNPS